MLYITIFSRVTYSPVRFACEDHTSSYYPSDDNNLSEIVSYTTNSCSCEASAMILLDKYKRSRFNCLFIPMTAETILLLNKMKDK